MIASLYEKIKRKLPRSSFLRSVGVLVGGTSAVQALAILASPILTRLYAPEDFGLLAVYVAILSLFTVVSSLRYELAIPLPQKDEDAFHLAILSLFIVCFVTLLSGLIILFSTTFLLSVLMPSSPSEYFWLVPIGVFFVGFYQVFNYWAIRNKNFTGIAKTQISQSLTTLVMQLSCFKIGAGGLIVGQSTGQAVGVYALAKPFIEARRLFEWSWGGVKRVALRYKNFPLFSTWGGFLNTAGVQLPPILFAMFFSVGAAGLYALAHRILAIPMSLIGSAVGNVFFSSAADAQRKGELSSLFEEVYGKLIVIIMPVLFLLVIDSPRLFAFTFGGDWAMAGDMARWMAPWLAVVFVASPLSVLFEILEKQKAAMYFQGGVLFLRVIAIVIGSFQQSVMLAIALFSLFGMISWVCFLVWVAKRVGASYKKMFLDTLKAAFYGFLCTLPPFVVFIFQCDSMLWFLGLGLTFIFVVIYYGFSFGIFSFSKRTVNNVNE